MDQNKCIICGEEVDEEENTVCIEQGCAHRLCQEQKVEV